MSMVGTFDGFTAARLGIYAAQHGLRVTGNNVSNISTPGYTRQRVDQMSFKAGANDMYRSLYDNHVGSGALVTGINQIRDPYLDIRYRNASTDTYHYDTWLSGLQNIASILDEVGKGDNQDGLIYKAIQDLAEKLRAYSADPTSLNDRLVRNSAESLTLLFHNAAGRLESLYNETVNEFNEDVSAVNEILTNIRDLNKSIRESEIHGDHALEMRDERNRQIDKLSQYLDIKVEYSYETVGGGIEVEKLTIKLNDANPDSTVHTDESILVDGVFATQLTVPKEKPVLASLYSDQYKYLEGYTYLKKISEADARALWKDVNGDKTEGDEGFIAFEDFLPKITEKDADGKEVEYYLVGTKDSDVSNIYTETNDNFTIQLGKLLNAKGEEWEKVTTAWTDLTGTADAPRRARFVYSVNITGAGTGDLTFIIKGAGENGGDKECKVPSGLTEPADILAYVAQELNKSGKYSGYNITASSDGTKLIFTANSPGNINNEADVAQGAPDYSPDFSVNSVGGIPWLDLDNTVVPNPAETEGFLPADAGSVEYDEHGNVTKTINYVDAGGQWYRLTISTEHTHEITLDDNDLRGILQAQREMLTEEGEFASAKDVAIDESALIKRGIKYYQQSLDLLAQKFAQAYNQLNTGYAFNQDGYYIDKDGNLLLLKETDENGNLVSHPISATDGLTDSQRLTLLVNNYVLQDKDGYVIDENGNRITNENGDFIKASDITYKSVVVDGTISSEVYDKLIVDMDKVMRPGVLSELGGWKMGGELFTQLDGETTTGITAKNISISSGWSNGVYGLIPTFMMLFKDDGSGGLTHSTKNDNADHMVAMIDKGLTYNPRDLYGSDAIGPELFNGSFNDMLSNMMAKEGEDADITNVRLTTYATALNELDYSREGVSGVDLNDEAMNMVQYQKAMSAAMRVMTAIDEVLDKLINNTGIAGR